MGARLFQIVDKSMEKRFNTWDLHAAIGLCLASRGFRLNPALPVRQIGVTTQGVEKLHGNSQILTRLLAQGLTQFKDLAADAQKEAREAPAPATADTPATPTPDSWHGWYSSGLSRDADD